MIQSGSFLHVVDNSGAVIAQCIKVLNKCNSTANVGDLVTVVVKEVNDYSEIKKSQIFIAVVVGTKYPYSRVTGTKTQFKQNNIILLKNKLSKQAEGTRIKTLLPLEFRYLGYGRLLVISLGLW